MRHLAPALAVSLLLTTGWWDNLIRTVAEALSLQAFIEADQSTATPPPPAYPSSDSGCSMDPLGGCNKG
jgi:hypothetical protein